MTVGAVIPLITSGRSGDEGMRFRTQSGEIGAFVLDSLRGLSETLQYSIGAQRLSQMIEKTAQLSQSEKAMKDRAGTSSAIVQTAILFFDLLMLVTASVLYLQGIISFPRALIALICLVSSFGPFISLADLGSGLQKTFAAGNRVLDILEETPATEEVTGKANCQFVGASVKKLSFSYGGEQILDNISAEFPQGKIIGVIGKSGSGKSTLLKLLMRFWSAKEGEILISEHSIDQINTENLRDMQSYVTQETHLFHDSIANNLRIAKQNATKEELETACKKAAIHDFILNLPQGYDTAVGELGDTLSGGERQRIGVARAFLHDSPFMLLDEPTSKLDSLNEAIILQSVAQQRESKTVVLVSHRASTIHLAETVYSVEKGRMS